VFGLWKTFLITLGILGIIISDCLGNFDAKPLGVQLQRVSAPGEHNLALGTQAFDNICCFCALGALGWFRCVLGHPLGDVLSLF